MLENQQIMHVFLEDKDHPIVETHEDFEFLLAAVTKNRSIITLKYDMNPKLLTSSVTKERLPPGARESL